MSPGKPNRRQFLQTGIALTAGATGRIAGQVLPGARAASKDPAREWHHYGGDPGATRYSPLDQIKPSNVKQLKVAWVHHTEDAMERPATTIECEPTVVDGVMYIQTAQLQTRALDPVTGKALWNFDPRASRQGRGASGFSRGVTYWQNPDDAKDRRIYAPDAGQLHCLNAKTGEPNPGFAQEGVLDLVKGYDPDRPDQWVRLTSPPTVYNGILICGGEVGEAQDAAPGHIRGFDAKTGKLRWIFHTIPKPGEFGHDTWGGDSWKRAGGTNNWGGMSVDLKRGWVFASTGAPSFNYYAGDRKGTNLFSDCVLALKAETGERVWHFQTTHHDTWDYDLPCQPSLITMSQGGRQFDAVAQMSKMGLVFLFDRATGKPVFPIEERPVPASTVPGEELWPTQPFPVKPPPLNRLNFSEDEVANLSPESKAAILAVVRKSKYGPIYTPISLEGTIVHPGFRGGVLWGGASFDPKLGRLFVNSDESANVAALSKAPPDKDYPYVLTQRARFLDPDGYPAIKPPWGYMTAIDLESGSFAWRVVNGEYEALKARGVAKTGTYSTGGSIATAGGLVFIASTYDGKFRAFDSKSGEILWEYALPAAGYTNPCTYEVNGRQFVTIACGGGKGFSKPGDQVVTFAL
ncbi:MAG TPA: pyrroloquinoline quinone-dependent dehydrogenase [Candidatus Acidoferrales bacterium]|nr:pyrroloquinoline quinone-dependent dehydrogenase [Candidatus Acidoferrales bacterium]